MPVHSSQQTLRRLLLVLAIVVSVSVLAIAFEQTEVSLEETRDATRQSSLSRALRELLSPDLFDQDRESQFAGAGFQMQCGGNGTPRAPARADGEPYLVISPTCGESGDIITVEGFNFRPNTPSILRWIPPGGQPRPLTPLDAGRSLIDIGRDGHFVTQIEVPRIRGGGGELHEIQSEAQWRVGLPRLSATTRLVLEKMVETVLLAFMATIFAIPVAFALSFLAARNLMRQVSMPSGAVFIGFLMVPLGGLLGALILDPIGRFGVDLGTGDIFTGPASTAAPALLLFASAVASGVSRRGRIEHADTATRLRLLAVNLVMLAGAIFALGVAGGLLTLIGNQLDSGILNTPGNFFRTLGDLTAAAVPFIAMLSSAVVFASGGVGLTQSGLKQVTGIESRLLGALLGALSGGVLLGGIALVATRGALLGLLVPVVAAVIAFQTTASLYNYFFNVDRLRHNVSASTETMRFFAGLVGAVAVFALSYGVLNVSRGLVSGQLPLDDRFHLLGMALPLRSFVGKAALIGAALTGINGLLAGLHNPVAIGMTTYNTTRAILNALRSIEPLIMGIVFVIWVGVGPFAGVLALMLHSIAALGKLYSEQIENIDPGPLEAIQSTGATRLQTIVYGVVPQIIPPYIAFTLYRWDINVRMSTIIGFVGGGGIGFVLQQQINLLRYRDAGVAMLAIAIVVSVLDYVSASIRERII